VIYFMTVTPKGKILAGTVVAVLAFAGLSYSQVQLQKQLSNLQRINPVPVTTVTMTPVPTAKLASPSATITATPSAKNFRTVYVTPGITSTVLPTGALK